MWIDRRAKVVTSRVYEIFAASGARPTCSEPKLYMRMGQPVRSMRPSGGSSVATGHALDLMASAHMGDFMDTGPQGSLDWPCEVLTKAFCGDAKMEQQDVFFHTGIKHTRVRNNNNREFRYGWGQNDYASVIKLATLPELLKAKDDKPLQGLLLTCFHTLLGAVARLLQARMDIAVYVSALQRRMHAPRGGSTESYGGLRRTHVGLPTTHCRNHACS